MLPTTKADAEASGEDAQVNSWFAADTKEDPCLPAMSYKQRLFGFMGCLVFAILCFALASLYLPMLVLKARKFALLFTLGSLMVLGSMSMIKGPYAFFQYMITKDRVVFSVAYIASLVGTLYCALILRTTIGTIFAASIQLLALSTNVLQYVPGGLYGLKMIFKAWYHTMKSIVIPTATKCLPAVFTV